MPQIDFLLTRLSQGEGLIDSDFDDIEELLAQADVAYAQGTPIIEDSIYDYIKDILQRGRPNSPFLYRTYEETYQEMLNSEHPDQVMTEDDYSDWADESGFDEFDGSNGSSDLAERKAGITDPSKYFEELGEWGELLEEHPMMSIQTIKDYHDKEFWDFINSIDLYGEDLFLSMKLNGHGIRVVYKDGDLVSATSRARRGRGRDITPRIAQVLPIHVEQLEGYGLVEIRGELVLPLSRLAEARAYNPGIKSAFSAVSSLVSDSAGSYVSLLKMVCYNAYFANDGELPAPEFPTKESEYDWLEEHGFEVPLHITAQFDEEDLNSEQTVVNAMESLVNWFAEEYESYGYFCDGVVVQLNSNDSFNNLGNDGLHNLGNIALKVGEWKQVGYTGRVVSIEWTEGKTKLSPVALVESLDEPGLGVLVAQGNRVRRVPLYEPANVLVLGAKPGALLHFNYGGESAVVPVDEAGRTLKDSSAEDRLIRWMNGE